MLKVTYEVGKDSYAAELICKAAHKVKPQDIKSYSKEYSEFIEELNKKLAEAFEEGRSFQKRYKEEDD